MRARLAVKFRPYAAFLSAAAATVGMSAAVHAGEKPGYPFPEHIDQHTIKQHSFEEIYRWGEKLFSSKFNSIDGVGANISQDPPGSLISMRFVRSPRADLPGWLRNPRRPDGPQSQNCIECHNERGDNNNAMNEQRDAFRSGDIRQWITRQPTHIAGAGALQLLAEQSSREMYRIRDQALAEAKRTNRPVTARLITSNNIDYGSVTARPDGTVDTSDVQGVSAQDAPIILTTALSVQPFHLKGIVAFLRFFAAGSTDVTVGLQSPERELETEDADGDGVVEELSVGDITALTLYLAGQARPVTKLELHKFLGGRHQLSGGEIASIESGERLFSNIGCASCHTPVLHLKDATFREPSTTPGFNFPMFRINNIVEVNGEFEIQGTDPRPYGYNLNNPVTFNLTAHPVVAKACDRLGVGKRRHRSSCFLQFESDDRGGAYIPTYGDQKRHDMGPGLAEPIDEFGIGPSVWRTKELWGVGSTGPWLHDGRATTLTEAILWHGGEAQSSRDHFAGLPERQKDDVIAFLQNLVTYVPPKSRF